MFYLGLIFGLAGIVCFSVRMSGGVKVLDSGWYLSGLFIQSLAGLAIPLVILFTRPFFWTGAVGILQILCLAYLWRDDLHKTTNPFRILVRWTTAVYALCGYFWVICFLNLP